MCASVRRRIGRGLRRKHSSHDEYNDHDNFFSPFFKLKLLIKDHSQKEVKIYSPKNEKNNVSARVATVAGRCFCLVSVWASLLHSVLINLPSQRKILKMHFSFIRQKSKADFTVGNILSFNQYFGRHGLPSSGSYI